MSYNKTYKHRKNGLVQRSFYTYNTGFKITISIGTGVDGEATCISIYDSNLYPDNDSRSEQKREYIIPFDDTDDLVVLCDTIKEVLKERNKTLINKSKKQ